MNTILLAILFVAFVLLSVIIVLSPVEHTAVKSSLDDGNLIKMAITPDYVGGLKKVLENTRCRLLLLKDKFIVKIAFKGIDFTIPFDKIISVEAKNEKQLYEDPDIFQLFLDNSIYFSNKIEKHKENVFIVISYINCESEERRLILQYSESEEFIEKYKETFSYWKCGYSNCDISEHAMSLNLT